MCTLGGFEIGKNWDREGAEVEPDSGGHGEWGPVGLRRTSNHSQRGMQM